MYASEYSQLCAKQGRHYTCRDGSGCGAKCGAPRRSCARLKVARDLVRRHPKRRSAQRLQPQSDPWQAAATRAGARTRLHVEVRGITKQNGEGAGARVGVTCARHRQRARVVLHGVRDLEGHALHGLDPLLWRQGCLPPVQHILRLRHEACACKGAVRWLCRGAGVSC